MLPPAGRASKDSTLKGEFNNSASVDALLFLISAQNWALLFFLVSV
jgi:hypothetical protein